MALGVALLHAAHTANTTTAAKPAYLTVFMISSPVSHHVGITRTGGIFSLPPRIVAIAWFWCHLLSHGEWASSDCESQNADGFRVALTHVPAATHN
jgi:hypothetical protein